MVDDNVDVIISTAFSTSMLSDYEPVDLEIKIRELSFSEVQDVVERCNIFNHVSNKVSSKIISNLLNIEENYTREKLRLELGNIILVARFMGTRADENDEYLPEGGYIIWYLVEIN